MSGKSVGNVRLIVHCRVVKRKLLPVQLLAEHGAKTFVLVLLGMLLERDPLQFHRRILRTPFGGGPKRVHGSTLVGVIDDCDDGDERNLDGDEDGQEPADTVSPVWVEDDSSVRGLDPEVNADPENGDQKSRSNSPTNLLKRSSLYLFLKNYLNNIKIK